MTVLPLNGLSSFLFASICRACEYMSAQSSGPTPPGAPTPSQAQAQASTPEGRRGGGEDGGSPPSHATAHAAAGPLQARRDAGVA